MVQLLYAILQSTINTIKTNSKWIRIWQKHVSFKEWYQSCLLLHLENIQQLSISQSCTIVMSCVTKNPSSWWVIFSPIHQHLDLIYIYRYHWYRWTYIRDYIWIYDLLVTTDWGIWHNHSHHTAPGWWCRCWCGRGRCRCTPLSEWSGQLNLRNNFENGIKWIYTSKERYLPTWNGRDCATQNGIRSFNFKWWNNCLTYHHAQRMYLKHHVNSDSKRIRRYSNNPI